MSKIIVIQVSHYKLQQLVCRYVNPFSCFGFRILVLCMLAHRLCLKSQPIYYTAHCPRLVYTKTVADCDMLVLITQLCTHMNSQQCSLLH